MIHEARGGKVDCRWGSMSYLELMDEDVQAAQKEIDAPHVKLEQWVRLL